MGVEEKFSPGLDGVVAAETNISFLDTIHGEIVIKGYDLIELSKTSSYLDIVHLLLEEGLTNPEQKAALEEKLKREYDVPLEVFEMLKLLPAKTHPMDGLRTGISALSGSDSQLDGCSLAANKNRAYQLLGKIPNIVANSYRILHKEALVAPRQELSYSANFLYNHFLLQV